MFPSHRNQSWSFLQKLLMAESNSEDNRFRRKHVGHKLMANLNRLKVRLLYMFRRINFLYSIHYQFTGWKNFKIFLNILKGECKKFKKKLVTYFLLQYLVRKLSFLSQNLFSYRKTCFPINTWVLFILL